MWFIFQKIKYIYQEGKFQPVEFPINDPYQEYHKWKGYESLMQVSAAEQRFGKNKYVCGCGCGCGCVGGWVCGCVCVCVWVCLCVRACVRACVQVCV